MGPRRKCLIYKDFLVVKPFLLETASPLVNWLVPSLFLTHLILVSVRVNANSTIIKIPQTIKSILLFPLSKLVRGLAPLSKLVRGLAPLSKLVNSASK